jgi:hypothetical protein
LTRFGTNGAGGPGSQPLVVTLATPVVVTATAGNFHGQSATITVTYNPVSVSGTASGGGGSGGGSPTTAQFLVSVERVLGPYSVPTVPPGFCRATLTWQLTPGMLTGSTGTATPFTQTSMLDPMPSSKLDSPTGLYFITCGYGQMIGNLRLGTWTLTVMGNWSTDLTTAWQAQCQVLLLAGLNGRRLAWGQMVC